MTNVLVIDSDLYFRLQMVELFAAAEEFNVVAHVDTREAALEAMRTHHPQLVSLDVRNEGSKTAELVRDLIAIHPVPVVLVSDAPRTSPPVTEALAAGALDLVDRPRLGDKTAKESFLKLMRVLCRVRVRGTTRSSASPSKSPIRLVVIGASTGGPGALMELLRSLPPTFHVPVVVAQHLARGYDSNLAEWLSEDVKLKVKLANHEEPLKSGEVVVGLPGFDLLVDWKARLLVRAAPVSGYHPSVDLLFSSAADVFPGAVVGIVLSGAGTDGVDGSRSINASGGVVMSQDRASSVVYGMPAAVAKLGLVSLTGAPEVLARGLMDVVKTRGFQAR